LPRRFRSAILRILLDTRGCGPSSFGIQAFKFPHREERWRRGKGIPPASNPVLPEDEAGSVRGLPRGSLFRTALHRCDQPRPGYYASVRRTRTPRRCVPTGTLPSLAHISHALSTATCCGQPLLRSGPNCPWAVCSHAALRKIRSAPRRSMFSQRLVTNGHEKCGLTE